MTCGHQGPFTDRPPRFSLGSKGLALPHSHSICTAYLTPLMGPKGQGNISYLGFELEMPQKCIALPGLISPQGFGEGSQIPHLHSSCLVSSQHNSYESNKWGYNECLPPQPCCTPLIERPRPRAFREEQGATNNYAIDPEISQTARSTSDVSSPHMGERVKRHPVTSL